MLESNRIVIVMVFIGLLGAVSLGAVAAGISDYIAARKRRDKE
jgi:hypothetical protein